MLIIIWIASIFLLVVLLAWWQQWKSRVIRAKPLPTTTPSRRPSVYSLSGQLLSSSKEEFKNPGVPCPSVANPLQASFDSPSLSAFPALTAQLQELATLAWTTERSLRQSQFLLNPLDFLDMTSPTQVVEVLIRHAGRTTPGFSVPQMVPRVLVTSMPSAAGMFKVDEEGWVTIELKSDFFQDQLAAQAILAHEVCHYLLENSGIRKSDVNLNERYTDLCMFICGFGEIFLAGYRRQPAQQNYRRGHRLGYLSTAEYQFAQRYVMQLRQSGEIAPPCELETLKKRLVHLLYGDQKNCSRQVDAERRRSPQKSEAELYQDAIARLERDRDR